MEKVDILVPPEFNKSGLIKTRDQAIKDADWLGGFHLWIVRTSPEPGLIFQQRSFTKATWPGQLDVSAAGHYMAGEAITDGMREVREELGKNYSFDKLTYLGKKVFVGLTEDKQKLQTVCDVFFTIDNAPLASFQLQKEELAGIMVLPLRDILKIFTQPNYSFTTQITDVNKKTSLKTITIADFIKNWDNYQYKIAILAQKYINGENNLFY